MPNTNSKLATWLGKRFQRLTDPQQSPATCFQSCSAHTTLGQPHNFGPSLESCRGTTFLQIFFFAAKLAVWGLADHGPSRPTLPHNGPLTFRWLFDVRPSRNPILQLTLLPCDGNSGRTLASEFVLLMLFQNEMQTKDEWTLATIGNWLQTEGARWTKHKARDTEQAPWLKPGNASGHWPQAAIGRRRGGARQVEHPAHGTDNGRLFGHWPLYGHRPHFEEMFELR